MSFPIEFETYRGVVIWYQESTQTFLWRYNNVDYASTGTIEEVRAEIDDLIFPPTPPPPPEDARIESYKGVDLWFSFTNNWYYFSYQGTLYERFTSQENAEAFIDTLVAEKPPPPPEPTPVPPPVEIPTLPWYAQWLKPVLDYIGGLTTAVVNYGKARADDYMKGIGGRVDDVKNNLDFLGKSMTYLGAAVDAINTKVWDGLIGKISDIFTKSSEESINRALKVLPEAVGHSPEYKTEIEATMRPFAEESVKGLMSAVDPVNYTHSILSPDEAAGQLTILGASVAAANIGIWVAHIAAEAATLGQLEAVGQLSNIVINSLGVNTISSRALMIPIEKSILIPAEQHYNALYTPEIPSYQDLINQVVKEVISLEEFTDKMKLLGFNETWSQRIWDAHFQAPNLTDLLTAWRRGIIDEAELDRLMILVDLDPRFKVIFDTRKYVDPPLSMTRFLFETGNIGKDQVRENIKLQGYRPEHVEAITEYITEFQARLWRRRYITTLARGYETGVFTSGELEKAVLEADYTADVAKYIVQNADARRKIAESKVAVKEEPKLLSTGELNTAFETHAIDEARYRVELGIRGYSESDIDLKVKLIQDRMVTEEAGGRKVSLTQAELKDAWRYEQITEDQFRTEMLLRGLSLAEVEILIATSKLKWGVGGQ